ncbi:MAG: DoxX family membrane protein [Patescibacteria group bacterium]
MKFSINLLPQYAPTVLRVGISLVFLWFAFQQLTNTDAWTGFVPDLAVSLSGLSAETLVLFNGVFEAVFGLALLVGFYTRLAAALLSLHLFHLVFVVGYSAIGVRDFGLAVATLSIALAEVDRWTLEAFLMRRAAAGAVQ